MLPIFDHTVQQILNERLEKLEQRFESDVIFYYGEIHPFMEKQFRDFIEELRARAGESPRKRLTVLLNTPGGMTETAEKMVDIMRFHYSEVYFIVPDFAMSAGTILCMSGDKIFMDYSSSLGPIDPQVWNGKEYVPALGYLEKVDELLEKARKNEISGAELLILQNQDLATLSRYEQAKNLTITLLKKWLVEYKFKDWVAHSSNPSKVGQAVTQTEKEDRATQIAEDLGNHKRWHSHGRMIGINTLTKSLRLRIDDYSSDVELRGLIRSYNDLICEYIRKNGYKFFLHSRHYF